MLTRAPRTAPRLALVVAVTAVSASCAAAGPSARGEPVGGVFDEDRNEAPAQYSGGGSGPAAAAAPMMPQEAERATVASRPRGLFDFSDDDVSGEVSRQANAPPAPPPPPPLPGTTPAAASTAPDKAPEASGPRLVIYKGSVTVVVVAVDDAVDKLAARAKELGGYVEGQTANSGANNATVTLRVPAEKFYDLVGELGSYGQVTQKQISAEDVTKKVFDIELRLETAEKSRERLLDLLKQATKMEEILKIESEVRRLTDEIEGMKGELRFLKDQVALSTLSVTFYSNAPPPTRGPTRVRSRFDWINKVGIESVLNNF